MIRIIMRVVVLIAAAIMSLTAVAKKQDVGGKVIDENGQPLPFVNVSFREL